MGHPDEHEMLIEYSEMTSFDFNSKEFQEVQRDVIKCKNLISGFSDICRNVFSGFKTAGNY